MVLRFMQLKIRVIWLNQLWLNQLWLNQLWRSLINLGGGYFSQLRSIAVVLSAILLIAPVVAAESNSNHNSADTSLSDDSWDDEAWSADSDWTEDSDWGADSDWTADQASSFHSLWIIDGFAEAGLGRRLRADPVIKQDTSYQEQRLRINSQYQSDALTLDLKADAIADQAVDKNHLSVREANISFSLSDAIDIKAGRQINTWGVGDLLFLNDLFAKDWQSFFSGRDQVYLKAPGDAIKFTWYGEAVALDVLYFDNFTEDRAITGERFSFYSPAVSTQTGQNVAPAFNAQQPKQGEWHVRLSGRFQQADWAVYSYKGYWKTPSAINEQGVPSYTKLTSIGASAITTAWSGLVKAEFSYFISDEDKAGNNPLISNSRINYLLAYERELWTEATANMQWYRETTQDYSALLANSAQLDIEPNQHRDLLTLRLSQNLLQQKLRLSVFQFYSPSDKDSYLRFNADYKWHDNLQTSAGINLFNGQQAHTFFGQFEQASNAWLRVKYYF